MRMQNRPRNCWRNWYFNRQVPAYSPLKFAHGACWVLVIQRVEPTNLPAAQEKIRSNMMTTHTRKFVEVVKAYQTAQQNYKKEVKAKVYRQMRIVKPDVTEGECGILSRVDLLNASHS